MELDFLDFTSPDYTGLVYCAEEHDNPYTHADYTTLYALNQLVAFAKRFEDKLFRCTFAGACVVYTSEGVVLKARIGALLINYTDQIIAVLTDDERIYAYI